MGFPNGFTLGTSFLGGCLISIALPSLLRARSKQCIKKGLSGRATVARLKLPPATCIRWQRKLREMGSIEPEPQGRPPGHGKLSSNQAFLEELVAQDDDITLLELAGSLVTGVVVQAASIERFMRTLGCKY